MYRYAGHFATLLTQERDTGLPAEVPQKTAEEIDYSYHMARARQLRARAVMNFFVTLRARLLRRKRPYRGLP